MKEPSEIHLKEEKRISRYVRGTMILAFNTNYLEKMELVSNNNFNWEDSLDQGWKTRTRELLGQEKFREYSAKTPHQNSAKKKPQTFQNMKNYKI